ncbi:hypothetical protein GCM10010254_03320 [Streptomyces chromofuscus]|nr:hypothetical protein GCM10010254_03320 [Streptomyces chromofuscus]
MRTVCHRAHRRESVRNTRRQLDGIQNLDLLRDFPLVFPQAVRTEIHPPNHGAQTRTEFEDRCNDP